MYIHNIIHAVHLFMIISIYGDYLCKLFSSIELFLLPVCLLAANFCWRADKKKPCRELKFIVRTKCATKPERWNLSDEFWAMLGSTYLFVATHRYVQFVESIIWILLCLFYVRFNDTSILVCYDIVKQKVCRLVFLVRHSLYYYVFVKLNLFIKFNLFVKFTVNMISVCW